jgi:hypothetical protein
MAIKYRKESLSTNGIKVNDKRMSIFHGPSCALVLGYTNLIRGIFSRMPVENLDRAEWQDRE